MANRRKKANKTGKVALFLVELLVLAVMIAGLWFVIKATGGKDSDGKNTGVQKVTIKEDDIVVKMNENVKNNEIMKGYRNIALFGVDSRTGALTQKTRTDTIMIASIKLSFVRFTEILTLIRWAEPIHSENVTHHTHTAERNRPS